MGSDFIECKQIGLSLLVLWQDMIRWSRPAKIKLSTVSKFNNCYWHYDKIIAPCLLYRSTEFYLDQLYHVRAFVRRGSSVHDKIILVSFNVISCFFY